MGRQLNRRRPFRMETAVMTAGLAVLGIALYLFNVIDLNGLAQAILLMPCIDLAIYALRQMMVDALSEETVYKKSKTAYTASGASYGTVLGIVLGALIFFAFNIPQPATTSEPGFAGTLFFWVPAIVGGGRRVLDREEDSQRNEWRDTHRSIDETDEDK